MSRGENSPGLHEDLALVAAQDHEAFRRLYKKTAPQVFAICLHVSGRHVAAEDILQQVFIKVWRSAGTYDPARAQPMTWIGTIARNTAIDWHRKRMRRPQTISGPENFVADEAESADQRMLREEAEGQAMSFLSELGDHEEEQIRRIFFEGLTFAELSERENKPLGTVKSTVRRSILKLRQKFDDE